MQTCILLSSANQRPARSPSSRPKAISASRVWKTRLNARSTRHTAISFSQLRVVVVRAQHDLERPVAAHEAREVLNAARAGVHAEPRFRLTENRRFSCGEAHVAGQHEFTAGAADASLDLRDGDEAARAQMAKQEADRRFAGQLRRFLAVLLDLGH